MGLSTLAFALALAGTATSYVGARSQAKASEKVARLEEQQAEVENSRYRRKAYREMLAAQAASETSGANQGGTYGSGVSGGVNQAAGTASMATRDSNTNLQFAQLISDQQVKSARAGSTMALGTAISSLGGTISKNAGTITKLGKNSSIWGNG